LSRGMLPTGDRPSLTTLLCPDSSLGGGRPPVASKAAPTIHHPEVSQMNGAAGSRPAPRGPPTRPPRRPGRTTPPGTPTAGRRSPAARSTSANTNAPWGLPARPASPAGRSRVAGGRSAGHGSGRSQGGTACHPSRGRAAGAPGSACYLHSSGYMSPLMVRAHPSDFALLHTCLNPAICRCERPDASSFSSSWSSSVNRSSMRISVGLLYFNEAISRNTVYGPRSARQCVKISS